MRFAIEWLLIHYRHQLLLNSYSSPISLLCVYYLMPVGEAAEGEEIKTGGNGRSNGKGSKREQEGEGIKTGRGGNKKSGASVDGCPARVIVYQKLFDYTVETDATVEGVLDVAESNTLAFVLGLDAILGDAIFLDKEAFDLVGAFFGEFHVVVVAAFVVGEAHDEDFDVGVVFEDACDSFDLDAFVFGDFPVVVVVED